MTEKSKFPAIQVDNFVTANNLELNLIAIVFDSGDMESSLCFTPKQVEELIIGLNKSLSRIKERQQ